MNKESNKEKIKSQREWVEGLEKIEKKSELEKEPSTEELKKERKRVIELQERIAKLEELGFKRTAEEQFELNHTQVELRNLSESPDGKRITELQKKITELEGLGFKRTAEKNVELDYTRQELRDFLEGKDILKEIKEKELTEKDLGEKRAESLDKVSEDIEEFKEKGKIITKTPDALREAKQEERELEKKVEERGKEVKEKIEEVVEKEKPEGEIVEKVEKEKKPEKEKPKEIKEEINLKKLLNEAKIKSENKDAAPEILKNLLEQANYTESKKVKENLKEAIQELIASLRRKEIKREEIDKMIEKMGKETGLEKETIEIVYNNQQGRIRELARSEEAKTRSLKKTLLKAGAYIGVGVGLTLATGGIGGAAVGAAVAIRYGLLPVIRAIDNYRSAGISEKKISKFEKEIREQIASGGKITENFINDLSDEIAQAKQNQIDGKDKEDKKLEDGLKEKERIYLEDYKERKGKIDKFDEMEKEDSSFKELQIALRERAESYRKDIENLLNERYPEIKDEDREKIVDQTMALFRIDQNNELFEKEIKSENPKFFTKIINSTEKILGSKILRGGETAGEKTLTIAVFSFSGYLARECPIVRNILLGYAGMKAGEVAAGFVTKGKRYETLKTITSPELEGKDVSDELVARAKVQLTDERFAKSNPAEYARLKERVSEIEQEKIKKAENLLNHVTNTSENLEEAYRKKLKIEKEKKIVKIGLQATGAVIGAAFGEDIIRWVGTKFTGTPGKAPLEEVSVETRAQELGLGKEFLEAHPEINTETLENLEKNLTGLGITENSEQAEIVKALSEGGLTPEELEKLNTLSGFDPEFLRSHTDEVRELLKGGLTIEKFQDLQGREFLEARHSLLGASGAEVRFDEEGKMITELEIGKQGDFQYLDQGLRRVVMDRVDLSGKETFEALDAAKTENILANLRELIKGNNIAGLKAEDLEGVVSFKDGKLTIENYEEFERTLDKLFDHADRIITPESDALAYVDRTSQEVWQGMIEDKGLEGVKVEDFSGSQMVEEAKARVFEIGPSIESSPVTGGPPPGTEVLTEKIGGHSIDELKGTLPQDAQLRYETFLREEKGWKDVATDLNPEQRAHIRELIKDYPRVGLRGDYLQLIEDAPNKEVWISPDGKTIRVGVFMEDGGHWERVIRFEKNALEIPPEVVPEERISKPTEGIVEKVESSIENKKIIGGLREGTISQKDFEDWYTEKTSLPPLSEDLKKNLANTIEKLSSPDANPQERLMAERTIKTMIRKALIESLKQK